MKILNFLMLLFVLLTCITCTLFTKKHKTIIEPVNIVLIDESRVDNARIRHIFGEFLIKGLVDQNKDWLTVFDLDTLSKEPIHPNFAPYFISFDIMEYGLYDIEKRIDRVLISVKLVKNPTNAVMCSFIKSARGRDIEQMCKVATDSITGVLVDKLSRLQERVYEVPDVMDVPEDTLQIVE
jgi:hypothetical protein